MSSDRMKEVQRCTAAANRQFFSDHRELFVYFDRTSLEDALVAWVRLHRAEKLATSTPTKELYLRIMQEAFVTLFDSGTIKEQAPLSRLAWDELDAMRKNTGIGTASVPTPNLQLTPEQKLETQ